MTRALGVEDFLVRASAHRSGGPNAQLAGQVASTDLVSIIVRFIEISAASSPRLAKAGWTDLAKELDKHTDAYSALLPYISVDQPRLRDMLVLQARLLQPVWQDTRTVEPLILLVKSLPELDLALTWMIGEDSIPAEVMETFLTASTRFAEMSEIFAPDYDESAAARADPVLLELIRRLSTRNEGEAGTADGQGSSAT